MTDERLLSKMEGKTNFSRHQKQFDGLARLTPTPDFTTDLRCWCLALTSQASGCPLTQGGERLLILSEVITLLCLTSYVGQKHRLMPRLLGAGTLSDAFV